MRNMSKLPIAPCLNANYANLNRLLESYFNCGYRDIVDIMHTVRLSNFRKFIITGISVHPR